MYLFVFSELKNTIKFTIKNTIKQLDNGVNSTVFSAISLTFFAVHPTFFVSPE